MSRTYGLRQIALFLGLFLLLCLGGCRETIVHDLDESDANQLLTQLDSSGIAVEKNKQSDGKWAIAVASADILKAIQILNDQRLLGSQSDTDLEQVAGSSGLLASREDQLLSLERARGRAIEATLKSMPAVVDARVHLNLPLRDPVFGKSLEKAESGSGSVFLLVNQSFALETENIKSLVAGAVGLTADSITVLISRKLIAQNILATETHAVSPDKSGLLHKLSALSGSLLGGSWLSQLFSISVFLLTVGYCCIVWRRKNVEAKLSSLATAFYGDKEVVHD